MTNPKIGATWEVLLSIHPDKVKFWAIDKGAWIDLLIQKNGQMLGGKCKRTDAPKTLPSICSVLRD